jgi:Mn-containing catalase
LDTSSMPEVKEMESRNLHNKQWTFTSNNESSGLSKIFNGSSPFGDGGELEAIEGIPEGAPIPNLPDAPQEFASGLDGELKTLTQQIQQMETTTISSSRTTASRRK